MKYLYHDIKLLRLRNKLHATVVNDDFIVLNSWILGSNLATGLQKQPISKLHDVCLVYSCDCLSIVQVRVLKGVLGNAL